jgi:hypothetical protein
LRIWHVALLVLLVAVAIVNIQDQRRSEPILIGLASAGFVVYGFVGWIGWWATRRCTPRLRPVLRLILFLAAMAGLFLIATWLYLMIERAYLGGYS